MYVTANSTTVSELTHISAGVAYKYKNDVNNSLNRSKWGNAAKNVFKWLLKGVLWFYISLAYIHMCRSIRTENGAVNNEKDVYNNHR